MNVYEVVGGDGEWLGSVVATSPGQAISLLNQGIAAGHYPDEAVLVIAGCCEGRE